MLAEYIPYILDQSFAERHAAHVLSQLETFAVSPHTAQNPMVREGWTILEKFIESKSDILRANQAVVTVAGSMRYDDPHNLDYDIFFFAPNSSPNFNKRLVTWWNDELCDLWNVGDEGHMHLNTLDRLRNHHLAFTDNSVDYLDQQGDYIFTDLINISTIFNGYAGLTPDQTLVTGMQESIRQLNKEDPLMMAFTAAELDDTYRRRLERRGLLR